MKLLLLYVHHSHTLRLRVYAHLKFTNPSRDPVPILRAELEGAPRLHSGHLDFVFHILVVMASAIVGMRAAEKAKAARARALRESKLDAIFSKFDKDHSGNLDRQELETLLRIVSSGDSNCSQRRWPSLCQSWGDIADNHVRLCPAETSLAAE